MSHSLEDLVDDNEDRKDDQGCEYCGCPLYPHTESIIVKGEEKEITYLRCRNQECSQYNINI
jgi:hypothetical protein